MIRINLLKPDIKIYSDTDPGGIIDSDRIETTRKSTPCLCEILWDKKDFGKKMKAGKKCAAKGSGD